jgi:hypothetical protein
MVTKGSKEVAWNVANGDTTPSSIYLVWTPFRHDYDYTRKADAITFARDLVEQGFQDVRLYRTETTRTFGAGYRRTASEIINTLMDVK